MTMWRNPKCWWMYKKNTQMMAMAGDLNLWHAELDADLRPVEQRSAAQEEALRALGYIE